MSGKYSLPPLHSKNSSISHLSEHPSPLIVLLSSQAYSNFFPSPQISSHE